METNQGKRREKMFSVIAILAIIALEYIFFRNIIGNDVMLGDTGDARLNNLLAEHWFQFFKGNESFNEIIAFYPVKNTLSYTDMVLGFALPYSLLRVFGVGMYMANKIILITTHVFGSFCLYYFLKKKMSLTRIFSLIGVAAFSLSSAYSVRINHTQLIAISFVPLLLFFIYSFFEYTENKKKRLIYGFAAVTYFALLMYTSFYIAFFTILLLGTFAVLYYILLLIAGKKPFHAVISYVKRFYKSLIAMVLYGIAMVTPFFMMYLPTSKLFGARDWGYICLFLPKPLDLFNVSTKNYLFGSLIKKFEERGLMTPSEELEVGLSIFVMAFFLIALVVTFIKFVQNKKKESALSVCMPFAIALTVFLSMIMIIKVGDNKSLWYIIYKFVPGGTALRAVGRYLFYLALPVSILIAMAGEKICMSKFFKKYFYVCALGILALVVAGNVRKGAVKAEWKISDEVKMLDAVAAPPEDCKVMYVVDSAFPNREDTHNYQLSAWSIANRFGIQTINGYSGQFPIGWNLHDINDLSQSKDWIDKNKIKNIYAYDFATNSWISHEDVDSFMQMRR